MLADRNKTTHLYNEAVAAQIFERIKNRYLATMAQNIAQFRARIGKEA